MLSGVMYAVQHTYHLGKVDLKSSNHQAKPDGVRPLNEKPIRDIDGMKKKRTAPTFSTSKTWRYCRSIAFHQRNSKNLTVQSGMLPR